MFITIIDSFEKYRDKNALCIKDTYYTYGQLEYYTHSISEEIIKTLPPDDCAIGILAVDDILTYAALLAAMFNGKAYVPINPLYPPFRNASIIKEAGVKTVISALDKNQTVNICGTDKINYFNSNKKTIKPIKFNTKYDADNTLVYILFTSGSTGTPKGVPISRKNLFAFCDAFLDLGKKYSSDDRFLQMFDLTFDLSVVSYIIPLMLGACIYTVGTPSGVKYTEVYKILDKYEITFALMVPSIITSLKPYFEDILLNKLKFSLFCGEALKVDIINEWQKCVPNALIQNIYGPTEGTVVCFNYDCIADNIKSANGIISIGKPMKGTSPIIIDENCNIIEDGSRGELCISGNQITNGYYNNPDLNNVNFININNKNQEKVFYKTGDICYRDQEGDYMYCGRIDHQIKVQGYRIELSEVEFYAEKFAQGNEIAAVTRVNKQGNTEIVIFVKSDNDIKQFLYNSMRNALPSYMIPSDIKILKNFPYNSNGKINRKELYKLAEIQNS